MGRSRAQPRRERRGDGAQANASRTRCCAPTLQGYAAYWQLQRHGWRPDDVRMAEEAVAAARAAGDRELLSESTDGSPPSSCFRSDFRRAVADSHRGHRARPRSRQRLRCTCGRISTRAQALQHLGEWGMALTAIDEGLRMAAQSGHLPWASLLRLEDASLHTEALDFAGAAAIAREELRRPSRSRRPPASGRCSSWRLRCLASASSTRRTRRSRRRSWCVAAGIEAMAWSGQVLLRHGLGAALVGARRARPRPPRGRSAAGAGRHGG